MTDKTRARATSSDVARAAGVSRATVSFVLNDTPGQSIPESTRQRVLDAVKALNYRPSPEARMLRSGRSDVVLALMPNWSVSEITSRTLEFLSRELSHRGLTFLVHLSAESNPRVAELWRTVTPALVLTDEALEARELAMLEAAGIPHMTFGMSLSVSGFDAAQRGIGNEQAKHLIELGHRTIGYATTADSSLSTFASLRLDGLAEASRTAGLQPPIAAQADTLERATAALEHWRASGVTAVAAYNDDVAFAVMAAARAADVTIPDELSVLGADDVAAARLAQPPLTTVRIDVDKVVPVLVERIMASIGRAPEAAGDAQGALGHVVERATTRAVGD